MVDVEEEKGREDESARSKIQIFFYCPFGELSERKAWRQERVRTSYLTWGWWGLFDGSSRFVGLVCAGEVANQSGKAGAVCQFWVSDLLHLRQSAAPRPFEQVKDERRWITFREGATPRACAIARLLLQLHGVMLGNRRPAPFRECLKAGHKRANELHVNLGKSWAIANRPRLGSLE